ncbi:MAG: malectin domain-containing carbohydrate-binding protein [Sedimentisphaerales bacterium]|nr:malectin domain-containing carbohydrate-binding protein [Sedimentisphaerales bacterium]
MRTKGFVWMSLLVCLGLLAAGCQQAGQKPQPASSAGPQQVQPAAATQPKPSEPVAQATAEPQVQRRFELRVNCGAYEAFKDKLGRTWVADQELEPGKTWGAVDGMTVERTWAEIAGTDIPQVYQYERYSMESYIFNVPNGTYTVRLHFAETYEGIGGPGERVFSVSIQGQMVLKDLDLYKTCGGAYKALVKEYKGVEVKDGKLVIGFTPNIENPEINGIEIIAE